MNTLQAPIQSALLLAQLLERLEASRQPFDARQYQLLAERLGSLLADRDVDWQPLLARSPGTAVLYENLHYAEAGLCRSDLDAALSAELAARSAIDAARQRPAPGHPAPDKPGTAAA